MPAINFPSSPTPYQIYSDGTNSWQWNGTAWEAFTPNITSVSLTDVTYDGGSATVTESVFLVSSSTIGGFPYAGDASIIGKLTTTDNIIAPLLVGTASFATNIFSAIEYSSSNDPSVTTNPTRNNSLWLNSSSGQLFVNSDRTSNANEWLNLSTGSNVAPGNTFYSFVTASVLKVVSGAVTPLLVQLKDRFNKALNINTGQTIAITGSDGAYTSTVYSASGIFTASVTGPNKVTGSFRVSGSINGTLLTPITLTIVEPQTLHATGLNSTAGTNGIPSSSGLNGNSGQFIGTGGPQRVSAVNTWESASTNGANTLATTIDGRLYAWGEIGSLFGTGSFNTSSGGSATPTLVGTGSLTSSAWVQHSIGYNHAAAIRNDGTLWTWGLNASGALALGAVSTASIPTQVGTDSNWVQVSCGANCTLALKSNSTLWATGNNSHGQLGVGDSGSRTTFTQVVGDNWSPRIFAAPARTSYAIKNNGTMFAWGWRGYMQNSYAESSLVPDGISQENSGQAKLVAFTPSQESSGSTNWVTIIPSRGENNGANVGFDRSLLHNASYGVAGNRFYGWGYPDQYYLFNRSAGPDPSVPSTGENRPRIDNYVTASANIYLVGRSFYEIDSTGSLNIWGSPSSSVDETTYGITLPKATTIAGLTTTPQQAQLNFGGGSEAGNYYWHTGSAKIFGEKYRVTSNYNWKTFAQGTVRVKNSNTTPALLLTSGKISGSSFPTASGAPTNLSFKIFTGSSNNQAPHFAYIEFSSSLDDAEIQVSSSYPNATGSQFVTYVGPATTRAYISPPSYSINIKHDLRYFKNGGGSPTTASITVNYCPGNGAILTGSCLTGQFTATTANGSCGSTVGSPTCAFDSCSFQYSLVSTTGPCTDYGYNYGTYYVNTYSTVNCPNQYQTVDTSACYY